MGRARPIFFPGHLIFGRPPLWVTRGTRGAQGGRNSVLPQIQNGTIVAASDSIFTQKVLPRGPGAFFKAYTSLPAPGALGAIGRRINSIFKPPRRKGAGLFRLLQRQAMIDPAQPLSLLPSRLAVTRVTAAKLLECSVDTVDRLIARGKLSSVHLGTGRAVRVPMRSLERLIENQKKQ